MSTEIVDERSGHYALVHHEREKAHRTLTHGVMLLASLPVVTVALLVLGGLLSSFGPVLITFVYCVIAGPSGLVMTSLGLMESRAATKKLAALDRERLPEARLLR